MERCQAFDTILFAGVSRQKTIRAAYVTERMMRGALISLLAQETALLAAMALFG